VTEHGPLRGAFAGAYGEYACGLSPASVTTVLVALGAESCPLEDARLTLVARGAITQRMTERLGALPLERSLALRPAVRWLDESDLDALARTHLGHSLATYPLAPVAPSRADALAHPDVHAVPVLRDALLDPAITDPALRHRYANALVAVADPLALEALATVLERTHAAHGPHEALAFGQLAARGTTRYSRRAPLAIEFPAQRGTATDATEALARRAGAWERVTDERGRSWHRVRIARIPAIPASSSAAARVPFLALLRSASRRRGARVWIAGCALPADLPWSAWLALLAPLAATHAR